VRISILTILAFLTIALITFTLTSAKAGVYKWVDSKGNVHYSDQEKSGSKKITLDKINSISTPTVSNNLLSTPTYSPKPKKVIMYSTSWCGVCKRARQFMKQNNIAFIEKDIEKSNSARVAYDKYKAKGVPLILVGRQKMNGFSPTKLVAMLEFQTQQQSKRAKSGK